MAQPHHRWPNPITDGQTPSPVSHVHHRANHSQSRSTSCKSSHLGHRPSSVSSKCPLRQWHPQLIKTCVSSKYAHSLQKRQQQGAPSPKCQQQMRSQAVASSTDQGTCQQQMRTVSKIWQQQMLIHACLSTIRLYPPDRTHPPVYTHPPPRAPPPVLLPVPRSPPF